MQDVAFCPLCRDPRSSPFETVRFQEDLVRYRLCLNCGLVYQSPRMSDEELADYYAHDYRVNVQGRPEPTAKDLRTQTERSRHLLQFARKHIPAVARHLDIGSSSGLLLQTFREHYACEPVGVEPSEAYRIYAGWTEMPMYPDLATLLAAGESAFDLITMSHVLEHLADPLTYLIELRERDLTPDGRLLIEVPNLYAHDSLETAHLVAFSPKSLQNMLSAAGFRALAVRKHGEPVSPVIPLYITILACPDGQTAGYSPERSVKLKRRLGMLARRLVLRLFPRRAWKSSPDVQR